MVKHRSRLLVLLGAAVLPCLSVLAVEPPEGQALPLPGAAAKLERVSPDLAALPAELAEHRRQRGAAPFVPSSPVIRVVAERVVIDAASEDPARLLADLEALGLERGAVFGHMVSGSLPIGAIDALGGLDSLRLVRPAYAASRTGSVAGQGDAAMVSDVARAAFGVDGKGVTIGTLSDSFDCLGGAAADVASGDLPAGITVLDDTVCPGTDEGRGMMQLIHDVAPGASQAFHTAFGGQADFALGIMELATIAGAKVIDDDVFYYAEPMFQDGIIAQAVDAVVASGVSYFTAAGNQARQSYEAPFSAGVDPVFGVPAHDFDPGAGMDFFQKVTIPVGAPFLVVLQWDQPYFSATGGAGSANDLDIFLLDDPPTTPLFAGAAFNIGGDPIEVFGGTNPGPATTFNLFILHFAGPAPGFIKYLLFDGIAVTEFFTGGGTAFGHSNAAGAAVVGASFYRDTPAFGTAPPLLEFFSSAGGIPILFDLADMPTFDLRSKPNFVAPDGANTTFFGFDIEPDGLPNFFGTSAAAPHAAAVAALLCEAKPATTPAAVYSVLESTAIDMLGAGFDFDSGHGLIQADRALAGLVVTDHFMSYKVKKTPETPKPVKFGPVTLADQFITRDFDVSKLATLLLPAEKNGEGPDDPVTHLTEYKLKLSSGAAPFTAITDVRIDNQCNDMLVEVKKPVSILVPANKDLLAPPPAPTLADHGLDHFLCYKAKRQAKLADGTKLPAFPKKIQVDVVDQFQSRRYDLKSITKLCNPVDKSGAPVVLSGPDRGDPFPIVPAPIRNPDEHLVCYKAKLATKLIPQAGCGPVDPTDPGTPLTQAKHAELTGIFVNSQFGPEQLDTVKEVELCIPSREDL